MVSRKSVFRDHEQFGFSVSQIVEKYSEWVFEDTYMILHRLENNLVVLKQNNQGKYEPFKTPQEKKWLKKNQKINENFKILEPKFFECFKSEVFAIKCSKRGNDVYRHRVYRRFKDLSALTDKTDFFNPKDRGEQKKTRALFVTLTYDTKLCSFSDAWKNIGVEFNRFMSNIRKKFGKVSNFRVFEAFSNGHPHIHCILLFEETQFKVFRDKKGQFRVKEKDLIDCLWHSHADVKAMGSLGRGLSYLKKYLLKGIDKEQKDSKSLKTLALGWLFNKRAFSVSGKFKQLLTDLNKTKHNSNQKTTQTSLEGKIVQDYTYYVQGFVPAEVVHLKNDIWFYKLRNDQIKSVEKFFNSKNQMSFCRM